MTIKQIDLRSRTIGRISLAQSFVYFPLQIVSENDLMKYNFVRLAIDTQMRHLYFGFSEHQEDDRQLRFYRQGRGGKAFSAHRLYKKYTIFKGFQKNKKSFMLKKNNVTENDSEYQYYIDYFADEGHEQNA